jgi:hypothetical protein
VPSGFQGQLSDTAISLGWRGNYEADFDHYELYRDTLPIVSADLGLLLASPSFDSSYLDTAVLSGKQYFYRLRALDQQDNASSLTTELSFTPTGIGEEENPILPQSFLLHPCYPNPFNSSTRIELESSTPGRVTVAVYNVSGRLVATLHDASVGAGIIGLEWTPVDVGSGVFFIVARKEGSKAIVKVVYLK